MRSWTRLAIPVALLLVVGACSQPDAAPEEDAFAVFQAEYSALETTEEKLQALENFVTSYPNDAHAGDILSGVAYYRGEELGDLDGVYEFASNTLDLVTDPEARFNVGIVTAEAAHKVAAKFDLASVIAPLVEVRPLTFSEHLSVMETAIELEEWSLTTEHADQAMPFATAEQFRADYPDRDYSDEEIAERGVNRQTLVRAYRGWGLYNQAQVEEATSELEAACTDTTRSYVGVPQNDSCRYLATISLAADDNDRAIELAVPYAVMDHDEDALEIVTKAYATKKGSEEGFEEFLWTSRLEMARSVDSFTAADYSGKSFELDSLQDKVVLLAFWFPT